MPAIKRLNVATTANAVDGLLFSKLSRRAFLTLYASCVTAGDVIGLSVGNAEFVRNAQPNIEASADVVDIDRDLILPRELANPGEIFIPITATTAVNFILLIEYV